MEEECECRGTFLVHVRVDEMTVERVAFSAGTKQAHPEPDSLTNRSKELRVDAAM